MKSIVTSVKKVGVRVSLFVDPTPDAVRWAAAMDSDRIELYTEPYARAFEAGDGEASFQRYAEAAELADSLGLGVNAGHDLDLRNLPLFRRLPHLAEVSIGHALISHALYVGLARAVRDYLEVLRGAL
jgi:pyridoxine 5-phosphate synthase